MKLVKYFILLTLFCLLEAQITLAGFPCDVVDCEGRTVSFATPPERIVIAGRAGFMITNAAFFFKTAPDKLITYSKSLKLVNNDEFYQMVDPGFSSRTFNDFETSIEQLAAMKPDVILLRNFERQKYERNLEQLGIRVVFFNLESSDSYIEEMKTLSAIFGETQRGTDIAEFYRSWQKKISKRLLAKKTPQILHIYPSTDGKSVSHHLTTPATPKSPRVLHIYYSEKGGAVSFNVAPASWMQTWLVEQVGGIAVWKEAGIGNGWQQVGFDQIAAWKPEVIFLTSYGGDVVKAKEFLRKDLLWAEMAAIKQNRLFAFPKDFVAWDQPDSRWILGLCWLAATLHPEIAELRTDMHELYRSFFELYGLSTDQIEQIEIHGDYF